MSEISWCRHCPRPGEVTREHLPPKSAGNTGPISEVPGVRLTLGARAAQ